MITAAAIIFSVNILTSIIKRFISPKYGTTGAQVVVFILAVIGALYVTLQVQWPGIAVFGQVVLGIFTLSVSFYEVILQHIPAFKGPEAVVE